MGLCEEILLGELQYTSSWYPRAVAEITSSIERFVEGSDCGSRARVIMDCATSHKSSTTDEISS